MNISERKVFMLTANRWGSFALFFSLILLPSMVQAADGDNTESAEIFVLAPFEINDERPWLFSAIDGYEILSVLDSNATRTVIERLRDDMRFAPLFIPDGSAPHLEVPNVLVFQHLNDREVISKFRERIRPGVPIDFALFNQGDSYHAFISQSTIDVIVKGKRSGTNSPLAGHLFATFTLIHPELPAWYQEGLKYLLRNGRVTRDSVEFSGPNHLEPQSIPIEATLRTTPAELNLLRQKAADERTRFEWRSALFIHWGFFSDGGIRRDPFLEFVANDSRTPVTESMVRESFGIGYEDLAYTLKAYTNTWWRSKRSLGRPDDGPTSDAEPVLVRPATRSEVARILAEAYIALGKGDAFVPPDPRYLVKARETLSDASTWNGQTSGIDLTMGLLEMAEQKDDEALATFSNLASRSVLRPLANYDLALLLFRQARLDAGPDGRLGSLPTHEILKSLRIALTSDPRMEPAFQLAVALWVGSDEKPQESDLALLAEGARAFPRNLSLVLNIASLIRQYGSETEALQLARLGMLWTGDYPEQRWQRLEATPVQPRICEMTTLVWSRNELHPSRLELLWLAKRTAEFPGWSGLVLSVASLLAANGLFDDAVKLVDLGLDESLGEAREELESLREHLTDEEDSISSLPFIGN